MEKEKKWEQRELEYFFCSIEGLGWQTLKQLFGQIPDRVRAYEMGEETARNVLGSRMAEVFLERRKMQNPHREWERLQERGIQFLSYWDRDYPEQLRRIADPPKAVYILGKIPEPEQKRVAVIGARACSEYGRRMARQLGEDLAAEQIEVVSGMARGIDGYSQLGALQAGGVSYGVLGCGVDICYPKENRRLYEQLCRQGGILSEYLPGTEARPGLFPPRNRIISALSDVVVVVEARNRSGTLITVDMALEQGKEVMAVPGRVGDGLSEGCNRLLVQGAGPVLSVDEILGALGICREEKKERTDSGNDRVDFFIREKKLSEDELYVYDCLDEYPRSVEELIREMTLQQKTIEYGKLYKILLRLCGLGIARQESNLCFTKIK